MDDMAVHQGELFALDAHPNGETGIYAVPGEGGAVTELAFFSELWVGRFTIDPETGEHFGMRNDQLYTIHLGNPPEAEILGDPLGSGTTPALTFARFECE